jgi:glyoxylase-like metal-dependent hydrolase (beta-lactamase superfamily II)
MPPLPSAPPFAVAPPLPVAPALLVAPPLPVAPALLVVPPAAVAPPEPVPTVVLPPVARLVVPPLPDAVPLIDGETIPTALGPLEVIHTPGHSPGHVSFYLRERGILIAGDTVLEGIFPNVGVAEGHDCFGEFLTTLDRLQKLPEPRILPSHGLPFDGLKAWCIRTRKDALHRLRRVGTLRAQGLTPAAITRHLWDRDLRPFDLQLALTTVLAQILYLEHKEAEQTVSVARII